jgi:outer membrane protein OmpA-like peptidoglycan-associated protein/uncharacterized protein YegP (UPF0339 family)
MVNEDYLHCPEYENKDSHSEAGFTAFQQADSGLFFFAMLDADGKVLLKSEGYPQVAARENGIQSVIKNRGNEAFYSVKFENDRYHLSLRAANYKEIARSCSCHTEADALALMPFVTGQQVRKAVVAAAAAAPAVAEKVKAEKIDDDYLACKAYSGHPVLASDHHYTTFTNPETGLHYFAWVSQHDSNHVYMRSEGYTTTAARDNGMESVNKNKHMDERYSVSEMHHKFFVVLKAGNHQEIARSCAYDTREAAMAFFPAARLKADADAKHAHEAAAAAALAAAAAEKAAHESRLRAEAEAKAHAEAEAKAHAEAEAKRIHLETEAKAKHEHEAKLAAAAALAATAAHDAKVKADAEIETRRLHEHEVKLKAEAEAKHHAEVEAKKVHDAKVAATAAAAAVAAAAVVHTPKAVVETTHKKVVETVHTTTTHHTPPVVKALAEEAAEVKGGFNWWWMLLPLLGLLAWYFTKDGCSTPEAVVAPSTTVVAPVPAVKVDTARVEPVKPAAPVAQEKLEWIFFDYDKSNIRGDAQAQLDKMASILKAHPEYTGSLRAFTDGKGTSAYNDALSGRRAEAAKAYLVAKGIDAKRITEEKNGMNAPVAQNTADDSGRKYNRRVELSVKDSKGNSSVISVPPTIAAGLQAK